MEVQSSSPDLKNFYTPLPQNVIQVNHQVLIDIFKKHQKDRLRRYVIKDINGNKLGSRNYWEMYFSYKESKSPFKGMFPFACRGYQYVLMPPNYNMVIHKDISYLQSRIGLLLKGSAPVRFFRNSNEFSLIGTYDYKIPALFNVTKYHNVINNDMFRITFFINFEEDYKEVYTMLTGSHI